MKTKVVAQIVLAVVLVAGAVAGWLYIGYRDKEAKIVALTEEAKRLVTEERPDREGMTAHLRALGKHPLFETEPRLVRARARLELALDRPQNAAAVLENVASSGEATAEDLALAAEAHGRMHAFAGKVEDAFRAMSDAERASEKLGGDPALLFKAWQYAVRAGHRDDSARIADRLAKSAAGSVEAKVVAALVAFDPADPKALANLLDLDQQLGHFEPELAVAIATLELQKSDESALGDAVDRAKLAVRVLPTSVEVRHVAAVAFHARGDQPQRDLHLRWLLDNAPQDERAAKWRALLESAVPK